MTRPQNANIKVDRVHDIAVIVPHGDLERYQETLLTRMLSSLLDTQTRKVVLDLTHVEHVHYELLKRLIKVPQLFQGINGDLRFAAATPYVKKIFTFVTEDAAHKIFNSLGDAILSFSEFSVPEQALH